MTARPACQAALAALCLWPASGCAGRPAHVAIPRVPADADQLYVQDLVFDPLSMPAPLAPALRAAGDTAYVIVQFRPGQSQAVSEAVRRAGGRIYGPLARHGWLVGGLTRAQLAALVGVRAVEPYHPGYKLTPGLRAVAVAGGGERLRLVVSVFDQARPTAEALRALGATVRGVDTATRGTVLEVELPATLLSRLAALPEVQRVEPATLPLRLLDRAPVLINVRSNGAPPWQNRFGLDGTGQILGIYDSGGDTGDTGTLVTDLRNRLTGDIANWGNTWWTQTQGWPQSWADLSYDNQPDTHGTFVSDVAIGNGASSAHGLLTGVAFAATAVMRPQYADSNGLQPGALNLDRALTNAFAAGARVHNDSWGPATGTWPDLDPVLNTYDAGGAAVIDNFLYQTPQLLVVTSAGNSGDAANTLSSLSCSKNSLAVGSSGNGKPPTGAVQGKDYDEATLANEIWHDSARGPAPGARLKPDVVAPGAMVAGRCSQSTEATCADDTPYAGQPGFFYARGTSISAPLVSGTALLLRQFLVDNGLEQNPSGMLLKALLVNGAQPLYDFVPDNAQGWGRIDLQASLQGGGQVMYFDSLNEQGGSFRFVQAGQAVLFENVRFFQGQPLHITLTWYDPPDQGHSGALINDLDLSLEVGGTLYQGGVPSMRDGQTEPNGAADTHNNTEKLILNAAPQMCTQPPGCTITVRATTITQPQAFALVVSGIEDQGSIAGRRLRALQAGTRSRPGQAVP